MFLFPSYNSQNRYLQITLALMQGLSKTLSSASHAEHNHSKMFVHEHSFLLMQKTNNSNEIQRNQMKRDDFITEMRETYLKKHKKTHKNTLSHTYCILVHYMYVTQNLICLFFAFLLQIFVFNAKYSLMPKDKQ